MLMTTSSVATDRLAAVAPTRLTQKVVIVNGDLVIDGQAGPAGPHFPVTLKVIGDRPRRLAELQGTVVARVIAPPEPFPFDADEPPPQAARASGHTTASPAKTARTVVELTPSTSQAR